MQRSFEHRERKASCTGATWCCTGARQGCTWCKRLLGDLCAVGPKDLLHPLLTTCVFLTPLPGALACKDRPYSAGGSAISFETPNSPTPCRGLVHLQCSVTCLFRFVRASIWCREEKPTGKRGRSFPYSWSFFCLQLSFFAYIALRYFFDAASHCKQERLNCEQNI